MSAEKHTIVNLLVPEDEPSIESKLETLELIFEHIGEGVCVINTEGIITHFNKAYGKFLDIDPKAQIGQHITDVVENTRMHIVAKTGRAEINESQSIKGHKMIVQRVPIRKDGKVIGVFGQVIFKDSKDVGKLAQKLTDLESRVRIYQKDLESLRTAKYSLDTCIGESDGIKAAKEETLKAAATNLSVLISGESGTGKEIFSQSIHNMSNRKDFPMIRLNCAAIPADLLESELFGYEKGAFTGAKNTGKKGKFELADKGTLFLDEIGDMPIEMQPKLLRVLEEKEFERLGGNMVLRSDFRLIAASNQDLEAKIKDKTFRSDLYYRLNVMNVHLPPLRERKDDVVLIAKDMIKRLCEDMRKKELRLTYGAEDLLMRHTWPGNVRELNNVMERTVATCEGEKITPADLPFYLHKSSGAPGVIERSLLKEVVAKAEKAAIQDALKMTDYHKMRAASLLGIHRTLLYKKIKRYGITLTPE